MTSMLLVVAVVQAADAPALSDALLQDEIRFTKIGSMGGLLGTGNAGLLLGIDEARYAEVVTAIERTCRTRVEDIASVAMLDPNLPYMAPTEVEVGGAMVFGVPVERFVRIPDDTDRLSPPTGGGAAHTEEARTMTTSRARETGTGSAGGDHDMKLIVAVVRGDQVDPVMAALLAADHRLTRINTTGGFLRRGNATLLIGAPGRQVDEVIEIIQQVCPPHADPAPVEKGLPMYSATVFVLDSSHFLRV